ncbi:hypothetical protein DFH09DRAFT_1328834 [Mycena vulgaris]|nr:hypothetical protein DFH09DRAFT_1328834 [Mycena vulgaris]
MSTTGSPGHLHTVCDSPPKAKDKRHINKGPRSAIVQHTRGQNLDEVLAWIGALEAAEASSSTSRATCTPTTTTTADSAVAPNLTPWMRAPARRFGSPRLGGPSQMVPRSGTSSQAAVRAGRREEARDVRLGHEGRGLWPQPPTSARLFLPHDALSFPSAHNPRRPSPPTRDLHLLPLPPRVPGGTVRVRCALDPNSVAILGARVERDEEMTRDNLWANRIRPPTQEAIEDHHKCALCLFVKSHPVTYLCGHSHCYVCICVWLEDHWTCPECVTQMFRPPLRQYAEEAGIACAYPDWKDLSVVNYSWEGLLFPKHPMRRPAVDSS